MDICEVIFLETNKDLARKAANAYKRDWAKKNREKVKAAQERYWAKRAAEMEETNAEAESKR